MENWLAHDADLLDNLARCDAVFRELQTQNDTLAPAFDRLMETLPREQRELILEYLNLQLDLEARKTYLAWMRK